MSTYDGGRAFPRTSDAYGPEFGMSMRDYFAAKAMQALCSHRLDHFKSSSEIARIAFSMADEMLKAREIQS